MSWWAMDIGVAPRNLVPHIAHWLVGHTGAAVEERDDAVLAAVPDAAHSPALLADLCRAHPAATLTVHEYPVDDRDWSVRWRDGLVARRVGRLTVVPSWLAHEVPPAGGAVVFIDPETAFGTGEHGSTRAALELLQRHLVPGDALVDVGSGSGILSIAAIKLGAARATGIEIDVEAVAVAERNAERNGVVPRCAFVTGDAAELAPLLGPVQVVTSNILRTTNILLLPAIQGTLTPEGVVVFSGMEETEAPAFLPALAETGFDVLDQVCDAGWWAVAARPC